jgi:hypothetical protein
VIDCDPPRATSIFHPHAGRVVKFLLGISTVKKEKTARMLKKRENQVGVVACLHFLKETLFSHEKARKTVSRAFPVSEFQCEDYTVH